MNLLLSVRSLPGSYSKEKTTDAAQKQQTLLISSAFINDKKTTDKNDKQLPISSSLIRYLCDGGRRFFSSKEV